LIKCFQSVKLFLIAWEADVLPLNYARILGHVAPSPLYYLTFC